MKWRIWGYHCFRKHPGSLFFDISKSFFRLLGLFLSKSLKQTISMGILVFSSYSNFGERSKMGQVGTRFNQYILQHEVHRNPCVEDDAEDALLDALCLAKCEELICVESGLKSVQKVSSMIVSSPLYFGSWTCICFVTSERPIGPARLQRKDSNLSIFAALQNPRLRLHAITSILPEVWKWCHRYVRGELIRYIIVLFVSI